MNATGICRVRKAFLRKGAEPETRKIRGSSPAKRRGGSEGRRNYTSEDPELRDSKVHLRNEDPQGVLGVDRKRTPGRELE